MLECSKCGADNPLGRVFCVACGSKLDLSRMSSEEVAESQKIGWLRRHWPKFVIGFVVMLVVMVALAFWPRSGAIGEKGSVVDRNNLARKIEVAGRIRPRQRMALEITEKNINGLLEHRALELEVRSMSADLMHGAIKFRVVDDFFSVKLLGYKWSPFMSYEVYCYPWGSEIYAAKAWIGRLRVFGPLKKMVIKRVAGIVTAQQEWKDMATVAQYISEMDLAHDDKTNADKMTILLERQ